MWLAYVLALLPIAIGGLLWITSRKVVWYEWVIGTVLALLVAVFFNLIATWGLIHDTEIWSGQVTSALYEPEWVEKYKVAIYREETYTDKKGKTHSRRVLDHYETRYRTHTPTWTCDTSLGQTLTISSAFFESLCKSFASRQTKPEFKSGFFSGDSNVYTTVNTTGYVCPVTSIRSFENRVKASPNLFSYSEVPTTAPVFNYPSCEDPFTSDRVLGTAKSVVPTQLWDQMNAYLGPRKKVNLIIVGFDSTDSSLAQLQESKWVGGKKNDLVLCYGGPSSKPTWTYVFGWTEKDIVKRNLETILLQGPIDSSIIVPIQVEVLSNYTIKDWSKFDYLSIEPPTYMYVIMAVVMLITQAAFWLWAYLNSDTKTSSN